MQPFGDGNTEKQYWNFNEEVNVNVVCFAFHISTVYIIFRFPHFFLLNLFKKILSSKVIFRSGDEIAMVVLLLENVVTSNKGTKMLNNRFE